MWLSGSTRHGLTALFLVPPACRVVDLGAEQAYQLLCFKMVSDFQSWKKAIVERFINSLDRPILADLFLDGIEPYQCSLHDPIAEAYYTGAV